MIRVEGIGGIHRWNGGVVPNQLRKQTDGQTDRKKEGNRRGERGGVLLNEVS